MGAPAQRSSDSSTTAGTVAPTFSGRPPSLGILIAVTMLGPMALNIFIPSMPGMTAVFDTNYGTIQLTLTLYLAGLGIAQLFLGPLSARFGRRPVLLAGSGLFLAGTLAADPPPRISVTVTPRLGQALGRCRGRAVDAHLTHATHHTQE